MNITEKFSRWFFITFSSIVLFSLFFILTFVQSPAQPIPEEPENSIPISIIDISLAGSTLDELNSSGKSTIFQSSTSITTRENGKYFYDSTEIRLRGNSTFVQTKKPYQIKFNKKTSLFGLGKSRSWVLLAHYYDPTHLRTYLTSLLASSLYSGTDLTGEPIELYIDGTYLGLYYLTEKTNMSRMSLTDPTALLVELDNVHNEGSEYIIPGASGDYYALADSNVVDTAENTTLLGSFVNKINLAQYYLENGQYEDASRLLDIDSFARYFLISELTENADAFSTSCYFYQTKSSDLIHAGPIWDFDLAYGNYAFDPASPLNDPTYLRFANPDYSKAYLYRLLYSYEEFRTKVKDLYHAHFSQNRDSVFSSLDEMADYIKPFATSDSEKWFTENTPNYDEEYNKLTTWLHSRFDFFDNYFDNSI